MKHYAHIFSFRFVLSEKEEQDRNGMRFHMILWHYMPFSLCEHKSEFFYFAIL